jgi:O-antigen/teichoic acid export membrane protein
VRTEGQTIFQNTFLLTVTELMARLLSLLLIMVVARKLGPELMGVYAFGLAFVGIFHIFVNFGLEPYIQREVSRHPETAGRLMSQVFGVKSVVYFFSVVLILIIGLALTDDVLKQQIVWILSGAMFFQTNLAATNAFFRGFQKASYEAAVRMSLRLIYTSAGLYAILSGQGLLTLVSLELVAQASACFFAWFIFIKRIGNPFHALHLDSLKEIMVAAWDFSLIRIIQTIFNSIDLIILSIIAGDRATGLYSAAARLTGAFGFIPNAFSGAFLPVLSRKAVEDKSEFIEIFKPFFNYLLLLGAGTAAVIAAISDNLIIFLFGNGFIQAAPTLRLLAIAMTLTFANWPLTSAIIALNKERQILYAFSICAAVNIVLNLILIPLFGAEGAAWAAVSSRLLLLICQYWILQHVIPQEMNLHHTAARPISAGIFTWIFIRLISTYNIGLPLNLLVAFCVFLFFALFTKSLSLTDLARGKQMLFSK